MEKMFEELICTPGQSTIVDYLSMKEVLEFSTASSYFRNMVCSRYKVGKIVVSSLKRNISVQIPFLNAKTLEIFWEPNFDVQMFGSFEKIQHVIVHNISENDFRLIQTCFPHLQKIAINFSRLQNIALNWAFSKELVSLSQIKVLEIENCLKVIDIDYPYFTYLFIGFSYVSLSTLMYYLKLVPSLASGIVCISGSGDEKCMSVLILTSKYVINFTACTFYEQTDQPQTPWKKYMGIKQFVCNFFSFKGVVNERGKTYIKFKKISTQ